MFFKSVLLLFVIIIIGCGCMDINKYIDIYTAGDGLSVENNKFSIIWSFSILLLLATIITYIFKCVFF